MTHPGLKRRFTIRQARPRDAGMLAVLFDAYRRFYRQASAPAAARNFISRRLKRKESVVFIAEAEGRLLGFTQLYPAFSSTAMKRLWLLNDLFVAAQGRRQGVAAALLVRAKRFAAETGAEGLFLETAKDNFAAQRLYRKLGWKRERDFYRYNLDL